MKIGLVLWDDWNIRHIERHAVAQGEVEELIDGAHLTRKTRRGLYMVYGQSDAGRYLTVVLASRGKGTAYVITAREMSENEKRWLKKHL